MVAINTPLVTNSGVTDVFIAEDRYALVTTGSGIDVVDLFCQKVISSGTLPSESLCVAADAGTTYAQMYVGTTASGVFSMRYQDVRQDGLDFTNRLIQRFNQDSVLGLTGDKINDLDAIPGRLFISTSGGVDFITTVRNSGGVIIEDLRASRNLASGSENCQMTDGGESYWSVLGSGIEANYDLFPSSGTGIINVDFTYSPISTPSLPSTGVNDINIVEGSPNLLGFATISGDLIVEESQGSEATSQAKTLFEDTNVISIAFSNTAGFSAGLAYVAFEDSIFTVGLVDNTTSGTHYHSADILLGQENTGDQALVTGTTTIVRTTSIA